MFVASPGWPGEEALAGRAGVGADTKYPAAIAPIRAAAKALKPNLKFMHPHLVRFRESRKPIAVMYFMVATNSFL
jgi:hypothetical protein